ncbi:ANTAR domain-containing protein [Streptomyces kunmingensis]|uniref:ANTAR domain-containing protein n=1 Tax=Streptomyces kunmingensis TaxID=68225 RepID=UPI003983967C
MEALEREAVQLREAVAAHAEVGQAIGIVVAAAHIPPARAWTVLRKISQRQHQTPARGRPAHPLGLHRRTFRSGGHRVLPPAPRLPGLPAGGIVRYARPRRALTSSLRPVGYPTSGRGVVG